MENNSDKQLRDKLNSNEFPFDPQAWEQMEAMLDEKKKRRGFFWWWTGGVAAALLLIVGTIGWGLYLMKEDDGLGKEQVTMNSEQQRANNEEKPEVRGRGSEENTVILNGGQQTTNNNETVSSTQQAASNNTVAVGSGSRQKSVSESSEIKNQKAEKAKNKKLIAKNRNGATGEGSISAKRNSSTGSVSKKIKQKEAILAQLKNEEAGASSKSVLENPYQKEVEALNAASAKANADENIIMKRLEVSLLQPVSENATASFDKKEEDVLPKKKKVKFNYSIGVMGNVTGTTLGIDNAPNTPTRPGVFYKEPSYMVGLTHDFLFVNRVAITNSILYSQTSFKVYQPRVQSYPKAPLEYSSQISELAIPLGIKVYPVVKNNFRFYINTGIINHIKLKETFSYTMPVDTPSNLTNNPNFTADQLFPTQTNFESKGVTFDALNTGGIVSSRDMSTADFSVNLAKRYYASFYAGAGFEYITKKHFIVFGEPTFHMGLQKIGVQEKRKYNFGVNAGFRYRF